MTPLMLTSPSPATSTDPSPTVTFKATSPEQRIVSSSRSIAPPPIRTSPDPAMASERVGTVACPIARSPEPRRTASVAPESEAIVMSPSPALSIRTGPRRTPAASVAPVISTETGPARSPRWMSRSPLAATATGKVGGTRMRTVSSPQAGITVTVPSTRLVA